MNEVILTYRGNEHRLPLAEGTGGECAVDISNLRQQTGLITFDNGFQNTASCTSAITHIDGAKGTLRYRGIPVEDLAERSSFTETAYLLIYGRLPRDDERKAFSRDLTEASLVHEEMLRFFDGFPQTAHPMAILGTMVNALSVYYPQYFTDAFDSDIFDIMAVRLISKIRTIAAYAYRHSVGEPFVYPRHDLRYCANLLHMMFHCPVRPYEVDPEIETALNRLFIIHADHEQSCSTSTVRLVGSSRVNLYSSICAGICALWGPLHGGASRAVIDMLMEIHEGRNTVRRCIEEARSEDTPFRLFGFGHRIYRNYDPRARLLKAECDRLLAKFNIQEPLIDIALELEEAALGDEYFLERGIYPNVDFYSGILCRLMGIPEDMFTVLFAIGRIPGWIAQWKEMHDSIPFRIGRPRQVYVGERERDYTEGPLRG
ncbi:MAG: citrate synthase [Spirochaetes bacterium]|nr:citrate synthase [Spirochaetota bacterium]